MNHLIRPLHIGKFLPPPYAGVEAHINTLLQSLSGYCLPTLIAGESPYKYSNSGQKFMEPKYKWYEARSYGKLASATISPAVVPIALDLLNSGECNILHIHAPNPWGDLLSLLVKSKCPVVMTWHSDIVRQKWIMHFYKFIQKKAIDSATKIIIPTPFHSLGSRQLDRTKYNSKIETVPLGIDFDALSYERRDRDFSKYLSEIINGRVAVLSVGRHVGYKGYDFLLKAMSLIKSDVALLLVGSGILSQQLIKLAEDLKISNKVYFLGEVSSAQLVSAYHICDFFTLPSIEKSEAFGIASAEAMSCSKPTIVCDLQNGVNYLNVNGRTSITVPARDPLKLANAIDVMANDQEYRLELGKNANHWVRNNFGIDSMRQGILRIYKEMIW